MGNTPSNQTTQQEGQQAAWLQNWKHDTAPTELKSYKNPDGKQRKNSTSSIQPPEVDVKEDIVHPLSFSSEAKDNRKSNFTGYEKPEEYPQSKNKPADKVARGSFSNLFGTTPGISTSTLKEQKEDTTQSEEADEASIEIKQGWLLKQTVQRSTSWLNSTNKLNYSNWKNRFFVLKKGCLFYYTIEKESSFSKFNMVKAYYESRIPTRIANLNKVGYQFYVEFHHTFDEHKLLLAASTEQELDVWTTFFKSLNENKSEENQKAGWLMIFNAPQRRWNLRYCICKGAHVEFTKREERGFFALAGARIELDLAPSGIPPSGVSIHSNNNNYAMNAEYGSPPSKLSYISSSFSSLYNSTTGQVVATPSYPFRVLTQDQVLTVSSEVEEVRHEWMEAIANEIHRLAQNGENFTDRIEIELFHKIRDVLEQEKKEMARLQALAAQEEATKEPSPTPTKKKPFFILSIDGGGMRGIITTLILIRITQRYPDFVSKVDMLAGCSNGGMVAMALAFNHDPKFCHLLLELTGGSIFKAGALSNSLNSAKFKASYLKLLCDQIWGDKKLKDSSKYVVIPAFLMDNHLPNENRSCEPRLFHNLDDSPSGEESVSDVVMRTIAAPTYFQGYQQYVDGGMYAHDPASVALIQAISPKKLRKQPEEVCMLSLGTGRVYRYYDDKNLDWGMYQWLPKLANCFWDGMIGKSEMMCREMLDTNYHRLDPTLQSEIPMDNPMLIPEMTELAKQVDLTETYRWIEAHLYD